MVVKYTCKFCGWSEQTDAKPPIIHKCKRYDISKWNKGVKIGITMLDRYDGHPQYIPTIIKDKNK